MFRLTIKDLQKKISAQEKLVAIAAYTAPQAKFCDSASDIILVGDSLGMVIYGFESTIPVTKQLMINHGKAVVRASEKAFIIVDMPFGSYQESKEKAFKNAAKIIKETGSSAVKLEAGSELAETVKYLVERGIVVIGHIGLMPQYVNSLGGYKLQGKDDISEHKIISDAISLEKSGAAIIVVEGVKKEVITKIKRQVKTPLIGIGASPECDGQVLVLDDLLGLNAKTAKFVKNYANLAVEVERSVQQFADEVRSGEFPSEEYLY